MNKIMFVLLVLFFVVLPARSEDDKPTTIQIIRASDEGGTESNLITVAATEQEKIAAIAEGENIIAAAKKEAAVIVATARIEAKAIATSKEVSTSKVLPKVKKLLVLFNDRFGRIEVIYGSKKEDRVTLKHNKSFTVEYLNGEEDVVVYIKGKRTPLVFVPGSNVIEHHIQY